jgi:hypothetical protein
MSAKTVTLNLEQKLYVIPASHGGYSCLGFEVLERRATALALELAAKGDNIPAPAPAATLERYEQYRDLVALACGWNSRTGWRSSSELTPELVGLEGKRVEVSHRWTPDWATEVSRFYVGKSMGFIPCHLEIEKRGDDGGGAVCLGNILSVKVLPNPPRR